ncbi:MICOS complex subunit mic25a isoform X1 [Cyprinodon tularosa]|uniref:MICOS complex subunit mic25a isoform X1 n=1 Tax=Cyprinodon tularosa TaxID=77115 RepID=UPI0018E281C5|nr:MICOS complex subunit mic25a isoform X1 [Cyprinodon tularosa]
MGSGESTTRKVSFGVDDEDRVRILRGIKLSEDVLQRMRGVANIPPEPSPSSSASSPAPSPQSEKGASQAKQSSQPRAQTSSKPSRSASFSKDEQRRYERQQAILKDELAKMAEREREAAREEVVKAMNRERQQARQEVQRAKELSADEIEATAQQLQKKDSQLKALEAFYREQLAQLEQRNLERFKESKDQFHQAASVTEASIKSRNTAPVCPDLQAQILSCYKDNKDQTLKCSDLAKEYMQCINAAKKNLLVNHG